MNETEVSFLEQFFERLQKPLAFLNIDSFIANHKHINYCECIMAPNGTLSYVTPSHVESLIKVSGRSRDEINAIMPVDATPIKWLVEYTGYTAIWYEGYINPSNVTEVQRHTLNKLIKNNIILDKKFT